LPENPRVASSILSLGIKFEKPGQLLPGLFLKRSKFFGTITDKKAHCSSKRSLQAQNATI
jgi:hypothetical protein